MEDLKTDFPKNITILEGRPVSRGIGIGKSLCIYGKNRQFYRIKLKQLDTGKEVQRFKTAVRLALRQIKKLSDSKESTNQSQNSIFETHLLFLQDNSFINKIQTKIEDEKFNAEWAVNMIANEYIAKYKTITDKHLSEKYIDLEDVSERLLIALGGGRKSDLKLEKNSVIIAKELYPSTLIELSENKPAAIITENGGWTSHTFILARELNLPAVTGINGVLRTIQSGEQIIVDGFEGKIYINPNAQTVEKFKAQEKQIHNKASKNNLISINNPLKTLDGVEIRIMANLDLPKVYKQAKKAGAKGIGLYRSEFLFNQNKGFPPENIQIESYSKIAKIAGKERVIIRTFDLNNEHFAGDNTKIEKNPALGLRAIRRGLKNQKNFRIQIRAILQAAYKKNIDIVLPMISDVAEILRVKQLLTQEKNKLKKSNISFGEPRLGAMIEVPAAVFLIEEILAEVDFVNLGTNDLVQYLLAVDRDNEEVADWFRTLHPAVIKSIKIISQAADRLDKPLIVCGEMAGTPIYAAILIGLGVKKLSMNLNSIPRVRHMVSNIAFDEAKRIADEIQMCRTSNQIEDYVRENFKIIWRHLFDEFTLPAKRQKY